MRILRRRGEMSDAQRRAMFAALEGSAGTVAPNTPSREIPKQGRLQKARAWVRAHPEVMKQLMIGSAVTGAAAAIAFKSRGTVRNLAAATGLGTAGATVGSISSAIQSGASTGLTRARGHLASLRERAYTTTEEYRARAVGLPVEALTGKAVNSGFDFLEGALKRRLGERVARLEGLAASKLGSAQAAVHLRAAGTARGAFNTLLRRPMTDAELAKWTEQTDLVGLPDYPTLSSKTRALRTGLQKKYANAIADELLEDLMEKGQLAPLVQGNLPDHRLVLENLNKRGLPFNEKLVLDIMNRMRFKATGVFERGLRGE